MRKISVLIFCLFIYSHFLIGQEEIRQYAGTAMPYPSLKNSSHLTQGGMIPFYINHLGRHGARFPTSGKALDKVITRLSLAEKHKMLTKEGLDLLSFMQGVSEQLKGKWGELSSLGKEEQEGIAGRLSKNYPCLFTDSAQVEAIATYVPRCINSMDAFLSCLQRENPSLNIKRSEGREYDEILRFFDLNESYVSYKKAGDWIAVYEKFSQVKIPTSPVIKRLFLRGGTEKEDQDFVMALFSIIAILPDTGLSLDKMCFFTPKEWRAYWQTQNLRQYMSKSSAPIGRMLPVAIAWPLLSEFIRTADEVINAKSDNHANFRFAHAETVIPFAALMGVQNADVRIADPDYVSAYWKDYEIAPMAANIQWVFCHDEKGEIWVKFLLNEKDASLPLSTSRYPYYLWSEVENFFNQRIRMAKEVLLSSFIENRF
ncbi:histidine-type phosphatase [uncultured Parabacteroides sp.]|mgnify:CR=1 FL=1|uniref:histidine-type phosphatase n=1 Tax=uncultured Parabacteroides sp. TaxID=512312 RepID=UPI0026024F72|nr:histidine-type phosphatase [uncultured Parabacteroides sp.]